MLEAIRHQLTQRYVEPHRAYHGMAHIEALLQGQLAHRDLIRDQQAVMLVIWFHDAVYDTHQHDNEERSALLAGDMLAQVGASPVLIDSVQRKVRATHRHEWTDGDTDTAVFLDLDLGILAASPDAYDRYAGQVAQEYNWVPEQAYKAGRAKVLQAFLDRPQVYFTSALQALWEVQARINLQREIAALTA